MRAVVVGYHDLRPVDWYTGKRLPLSPGEGHHCDRCDREHAVVYEVLVEETGKIYKVGSKCAFLEFGRDVEKDAAAKVLVRLSKERSAAAINERRLAMVAEAAQIVLAELDLRLPVPEPVVEHRMPAHPDVVRVGDGVAWHQFRSLEETVACARDSWLRARVRELTPEGWDAVEVAERPGSKHKTTMARHLQAVVEHERRKA